MERAAVLIVLIEEIRSVLQHPDLHITEDDTLYLLGLDSLDILEVILKLEDRVEVCINEDDVRSDFTVKELADLVVRKKGKA